MLRYIACLARSVLPVLTEAEETGATFTLSTRTFLVGETPKAADDGFLPLDRIEWIQSAFDQDPVLSRNVFHLFRRQYDVRAVSDGSKTYGPFERFVIRQPSQSDPEGCAVFSDRLDEQMSFLIVPDRPKVPHLVRCSYSKRTGTAHFCRVLAAYAYDRHISLRARLYSPGHYSENGAFFAAVAQRMHDVAECLDFTDRYVADRPDLAKPCPTRLTN